MVEYFTLLNGILETINDVLWHEVALYAILGVGILFTLWSGFSQYRALTHGVAITMGKYDHATDPGAINHFQALSAALSATVGIGNIGGVALAVAVGGPGAIFWMWVVGFVGMALKTSEVTLAMIYRNVTDPNNPHGGAMWVADQGMARFGKAFQPLGKVLAVIFCITLLIATITGGNMAQAFNVAEITASNFPQLHYVTDYLLTLLPLSSAVRAEATFFIHPRFLVGVILSVLCALVIIGGIKRIGHVAAALVPFMCGLYLLAALYVIGLHWRVVPDMFALIFRSAFTPLEAQGAFLGGTFGIAFAQGMRRALFSNEAGQGSAPIVHCAARTDHPVREGLVAGLEPFIDTLVVCTLTALVMLVTGAWNREAVAHFDEPPVIVANGDKQWTLDKTTPPPRHDGPWDHKASVFVIVEVGGKRDRLFGTVQDNGTSFAIEWKKFESEPKPVVAETGVYEDFIASALTSHAFDRVHKGMGLWLVTAAVWLFAFSTVISWSYYGEQGMVYLFGMKSVFIYRLIYCLCVLIACLGFITTETELMNLSDLGTGVMLFANLPILLIFGRQTMTIYADYIRRYRAGEFARGDQPPG
ncbi:MAG: alanine/glycine:cation symporter family protein [Gemmataceae bacterium]